MPPISCHVFLRAPRPSPAARLGRVAPAALLLCLTWLPLAAQQAPPQPAAPAGAPLYEREDGHLWQVQGDTRFLVDERELSLALLPGVTMDELLDGLPGVQQVRRNRAGVIDVSVPAGADPLELAAALRQSGQVSFAEVNTIGRYNGVPDDPLFDQLWHLSNTGQSGGLPGADLGAPQAWELSGGDPSVVVAVIDSGCEWSHPDLAANIWSNPGEVAANGIDDDGNGLVDDVRGWDFEGQDNDPAGVYYHGTAVAGVVAARGNNGTGTAGLAGGGDTGPGCRLMPLAVGTFAPKAGLLDDAIVYAADMGARVITLSLSVGQSAAIDAAITYAHDTRGVFIDCASGNNGSWVAYPAGHPLVLAVGSTDRFDKHSSFSNSGPELVLSAPGEEILMTTLGGGYTTASGTSFAAPQVGALAALLLSRAPYLTPDELTAAMVDTARDIGPPGWDKDSGYGRIDALAAMLSVNGGSLGSVTAYGTGLPGLGGKQPMLSTLGGSPQTGNADFKLKLTKAKAGASSWLLLGVAAASTPFKGGILLVDANLPLFIVPRTISSALGSFWGSASVALLIPVAPVLVGFQLFAQWVVADGQAQGGYALSGGLSIEVGG